MDPDQNEQIDDGALDAPEQGQQPEAESTDDRGPGSMLDALRGSLGQPSEDDDGAQQPIAGDDRPRGPDGRFLPKDAAADADPNAQQQQPAKPAAKPGEQQPPADDPYREPEGLKPEARERFQALVTRAKEATTAAETATAQLEEMRGTVTAFQQMIADTGADDREILAMLDFTRAVKAGNWQAIEPLLGHLTQQFRTVMGRDPNGSDPFVQHPDLAQAVQDGKITPEYARQVLQARQFQAQQQQQQQAAQAQQSTQQQYVQAVQRATQSVSAMVQKWSQTDLDWPKKQALMQQHAKRVAETIPPEHWASALQMAYDAIGQTMTTMAPPRPTPTPNTPQPLRPSAANVGRREPSSMQEAIAGAIGTA
jgi:hypothetical protein